MLILHAQIPLQKSTFHIAKMDCPSEEQLLRMKLAEIPQVKHLDFDISERRLVIFYQDQLKPIHQAITSLKLEEKLLHTEATDTTHFQQDDRQRTTLWLVLAINAALFVIEMSTGIVSKSMGLVADSLDMLADAFVYGISLLAVGGSIGKKKKTAMIAGYLQILLAIMGFTEVLRRFLGDGVMPESSIMIRISILALAANGLCLFLLQRSKSQEAHMQASMIFTSNDILINLGVILAAILVRWLESGLPDLFIGIVVFILVVQGARRILHLAK